MLLLHLKTIFVFLLIATAIIGAGSLIKPVKNIECGTGEKFWLKSILGVVILGSTLFFIGYFNWLAWWIMPLVIGSAIWGGCQIYNFRQSLKKLLLFWISLPGNWIALTSMVLFFLTGMAHPVGDIGHDGIVYHLLAPAKWIEAGRFISLPEHSHTSFPFLIEALFGVTVIFDAVEVSGVLGVLFSFQLLGAVWYLAKDVGADSKSRSWVTGIAATMPVLISTTDDYFVDVPFAVFALAMLRILVYHRDFQYVLIAGILAGGAGATKYTGLFVIFSGLLLILYLNKGLGSKKVLTFSLGFLIIAGLFTLPWYVRNIIEYHSPIIPPPPFLYKLLPPIGWPEYISEAFHFRITKEVGAGFGKSILDFILLPFNFTFYPEQFRGAHGTYFTLIFTPLAIWQLRKNRTGLIYLGWAFVITVLWFLTQQNARFLIHVSALFTGLCGVSLAILAFHKNLIIKGLSWAVILTTIGLGIAGFVIHRSERLLSIFSEKASQEWQASNIPYYEAIEFVNQNPDVDQMLLLTKWVPGFYLDKPYVKTAGHYGNRPYPDVANPYEALDQLERWGCSHIMDTGTERWLIDPNDPRMKLVFEITDARVYEIIHH